MHPMNNKMQYYIYVSSWTLPYELRTCDKYAPLQSDRKTFVFASVT
jgi:hypothetical protein